MRNGQEIHDEFMKMKNAASRSRHPHGSRRKIFDAPAVSPSVFACMDAEKIQNRFVVNGMTISRCCRASSAGVIHVVTDEALKQCNHWVRTRPRVRAHAREGACVPGIFRRRCTCRERRPETSRIGNCSDDFSQDYSHHDHSFSKVAESDS